MSNTISFSNLFASPTQHSAPMDSPRPAAVPNDRFQPSQHASGSALNPILTAVKVAGVPVGAAVGACGMSALAAHVTGLGAAALAAASGAVVIGGIGAVAAGAVLGAAWGRGKTGEDGGFASLAGLLTGAKWGGACGAVGGAIAGAYAGAQTGHLLAAGAGLIGGAAVGLYLSLAADASTSK